MDILEDKISPFSNPKTVTTVLDSDGLTRKAFLLLFTAMVLASVETEFLCLGIHNCFAVSSTF